MKEYGGYIELDSYRGKEYFTDLIPLNCGRSCLSYLIEAKKIRKLYLPYFLCSTVKMACENCKVEYEFYSINENFYPIFSKKMQQDEYIYVVNYYGQLTDNYVLELKERYGQVILDNAQAFFRQPLLEVDTIYTCRKFFGVPDGAYLATDILSTVEYPQDISYNRMNFLLGRYELSASMFYQEYVNNNLFFDSESIKYTSKLTTNLLRGIDYEYVKETRENNYIFLHEQLGTYNKLTLQESEGPFAYPLLIENGFAIRKKLQEKKIYIPTLWPDVFEICEEDTVEYRYARNILPLPVDQRYGIKDMQLISECIIDCIRLAKDEL